MYRHGIYAEYTDTEITASKNNTTLPVYFGVAPIHQTTDYENKVNTPLLLKHRRLALEEVGYSENWKTFTLCEALNLHFIKNNVAPIVFVNTLDPAKHRKSTNTTVSITFINNIAIIKNENVILNSISIADYDVNVDYLAEYNANGNEVIITSKNEDLKDTVQVTFAEIDSSLITEQDIAESIEKTISQIYEVANAEPSLLVAPGWSNKKTVHDALIDNSLNINSHWNAFAITDIEASDYVNVLQQKKQLGYNAVNESPCWPRVKIDNKIYHLSTLITLKSMLVDAQHDDIPYATVSNTEIDIDALDNCYSDIIKANELNAIGIKTVIYWEGKYRIWGPHTGKYDASTSNKADEIFDSSVRMKYWLGNDFQHAYGSEVDKPVHRSRIDSILNLYQARLDALVTKGALLYAQINFVPDPETANTDMMSGRFIFDTTFTLTPPAREIVNRYTYTDKGLTLLGGDK